MTLMPPLISSQHITRPEYEVSTQSARSILFQGLNRFLCDLKQHHRGIVLEYLKFNGVKFQVDLSDIHCYTNIIKNTSMA